MSAADRREGLIDCAEELFMTAGYEPTTINDIIARTGLSKGGFYHHFSAKEDLLDAIADRMMHQVTADLRDVLDDPGIDALTRFNRFLARSLDWKTAAAPRIRMIAEAALKPENVVLFERLLAAATRTVEPILSRIIAEGIEDGLFSAPDPQIVAEVFLSLSHARRTVLFEVDPGSRTRRGRRRGPPS